MSSNTRLPDLGQAIPFNDGQATITMELTDGCEDHSRDMTGIGEGEKLRRLLEAKRFEQKQLADKAGVTKQSVALWLKKDRFSNKIWERVARGLDLLGLKPSDIRPDYNSPREPVEDLTRLVENCPRVQLQVLKRILESDDTSREILLAYINGSLRQIP